jgi:hypothetical protein
LMIKGAGCCATNQVVFPIEDRQVCPQLLVQKIRESQISFVSSSFTQHLQMCTQSYSSGGRAANCCKGVRSFVHYSSVHTQSYSEEEQQPDKVERTFTHCDPSLRP